ncbi:MULTISPECIES: glycine cleavage system protein GcvH [Cohaesibacter]|uniref:glycine cleavage system protein GcvH n=1 Tax=Cohaesibacter TaxID=655352 RepID=UPI000DEAB3DD|nr:MULTISPECIES: glycine cleavage system protein GcvH [Cohaesibacter]TLP45658.1 glycine cleavage system protein GcvH [Cohaesibacter sp. CAU 1516]
MSTYYSEDHEWISVEGDIATIGITDYAQSQLGDVVFVELPEVGASMSQGDEAAVVESVKAASEVYAPIDGEVTEVNEGLEEDPSKVNSDAEGDAWFLKMKVGDAGQLEGLMDADAYKAFVAEQE